MADRGFALTNSMKDRGIKLNVPAFSRGRNQFSEEERTLSRRLSRLRIHVECAIHRVKVYRTLNCALPIHRKNLMNSIILVCAGLRNLKAPLSGPQGREDESHGD